MILPHHLVDFQCKPELRCWLSCPQAAMSVKGADLGELVRGDPPLVFSSESCYGLRLCRSGFVSPPQRAEASGNPPLMRHACWPRSRGDPPGFSPAHQGNSSLPVAPSDPSSWTSVISTHILATWLPLYHLFCRLRLLLCFDARHFPLMFLECGPERGSKNMAGKLGRAGGEPPLRTAAA